jgi:hypothetical protein
MAILHAYFDESGSHSDSDSFVVAGYLASVDMWRQFEAQWNEALNDFDLPFFHMADYANMVGYYAGWPENVRRSRLGRLIDIINRNTLASYGAGISKKVFETVCPLEIQRSCGGLYDSPVKTLRCGTKGKFAR